ncbi:MAG TPA: multidrug efflux RND transporter permease subunit, partial [Candidatus Saccharimonadia bacterium]|nr:multidrug efflux RND transporter permease subunit [Candidatus Saccharimonadia bacterium]
MNFSALFIRRPIGTTLLTIALALAGIIAYQFLPVSPLPQVEYATIEVQAALPGASADIMASAVATPLERQFGRIAGLNEMTSTSFLGATRISLQFDMSRDINAAARDVQAAINAARGQLPANLPNAPFYRKSNPADSPVVILALTSDIVGRARMYDLASSILQQKLSQVPGVGRVVVGGGALPAVRVEVNPTVLNGYGLSLEDVRAVLSTANANRPKGEIVDNGRAWTLNTTDQLLQAADYKPVIISYRQGAAVRLADVADVVDASEDIRNNGVVNGKPAILLLVWRQPGANIIDTVDRVRAILPQLQAAIPPTVALVDAVDRTTTIRASVHDIQRTLGLSILLVILVVFVFFRTVRTAIIPSVVVPVSLIGTFGAMYLLGYSMNNLSLMALTIATGFVVDDAIVVIENIMRHLEQGTPPRQAALRGAKEIGFTVLSITISLLAVFIPILMMGGIFGRLFREFAVTLAVAVGVSLVISLTTTPMMCAYILRAHSHEGHGWLYRTNEWVFQSVLRLYEVTLAWVLRHQFLMLLVTLATIYVTVRLYTDIPKGFFPQQDTGQLFGQIQADQSSSFQAVRQILQQFVTLVGEDPAVDNVLGFTGGSFGGSVNTARMFIALKPLAERQISADQVMARLRGKLARVPGARLFMQAFQDLRVGGRLSSAQYQFTLQGDNVRELNEWAPRVLSKMRSLPILTDVNSDQQDRGLEASLAIDRDTAARLGINTAVLDDTLYDAFGQRQVSTMYKQLNQYHVVLEVNSDFWQNPDGLKYIYVRSANRTLVPLSAFTHYAPSNAPLTVNHQGLFPAITISFNLTPGTALGDAVTAVERATREIGLPAAIRGSFQGTAQAFQDSLASQPVLIAAALVVVYIVLGILYESYIHPITILSTLPSAGVGALLALQLCGTELSFIAIIGIILLIGIVKKNAIMMIDFALEAERTQGKSPEAAIFQACLLRFRPIIMTTMAALLGGLPLALGTGTGAELRRPLGITIVGGLIFSQMLTLYTTPVVYLYLDRFQIWCTRLRGSRKREAMLEELRQRHVESGVEVG